MQKKAAGMPTEISRPSASIVGRSKSPEANARHAGAPNLTLLAVAAILVVVLHIVSGVVLERAHAGPTVEPSALAALDAEVTCPAEARQSERSLPFD